MAQDNKQTGTFIASTAAAAAALYAALQLRKVQAGVPGVPPGEVTLDEQTLELLIAMAQTQESIYEVLNSLNLGDLTTILSVGPNADSMRAIRVVPTAINFATRLPSLVIPHNMQLAMKGFPTNLGLVRIAHDAASSTNINGSWPLLANEGLGLRVLNANELFMSVTNAGESLVICAEQMKGAY